jgi:hypothetical protein
VADKPPADACSSPEKRQFDFCIGGWDVAEPSGKLQGTNRIESILRGCVPYESWSGAGGGTGRSFNVYVAEERTWRQTWVDDHGGSLNLKATFHDGKMDVSGETTSQRDPSKKVRQRITWERLGPDKVRQVWTSSKDGGQTWETAFDGIYVRQAPR